MLTYEFVVYILFLFIGVLFSFVKMNDINHIAISLLLFIFFSFVVRLSGFDADIGNYANYLEIDSLSVYYLKEPLYWFGSRWIYELSGSSILVFIFYDILFYCLIFLASRLLDLPKYFPYLILLFFPSVLGMQNVFRQFIASGFILLLTALIFSDKKIIYRVLVLILAALTHNVSLLFTPLIFLRSRSKKLKFLFLVSSISIFLLLPIAAGTKSDSDTGDLPPYLYFVIYSLMIIVYLMVLNFDFKKFGYKYKQFFYALMYLWGLIFLSMFTLGGAQSKRVGMISLLISLVPLTMLIESRFKQKIMVRIVFIIILTLPTLVFHNARSLLQTTETSLQVEADARANSHH